MLCGIIYLLFTKKMATKQTAVNVKEARLIDQWLHTTIASATWNDLITFLGKDMKVLTKAVEELEASEVYQRVGKEIEAKAHELVETKCKPEWEKIANEMRPIGDKRNELAKEKVGWEWSDEKEAELKSLDKQLSDLSEKYQKITDDANADLNTYKEQRINEEQEPAFFLSEKDYKLVGGYCGF